MRCADGGLVNGEFFFFFGFWWERGAGLLCCWALSNRADRGCWIWSWVAEGGSVGR